MTRVDFYLFEQSAENLVDLTVCKLVHKAFRIGHRVYILTNDAAHAERLDRLLWTFSAGSFIPHGQQPLTQDTDMPVLIGYDEPPTSHEDVLIQLSPQVPTWFSRFQRVAELVNGTDADKVLARDRFRFYRDRGYSLNTHRLPAGDFVEA